MRADTAKSVGIPATLLTIWLVLDQRCHRHSSLPWHTSNHSSLSSSNSRHGGHQWALKYRPSALPFKASAETTAPLLSV